MQSCTTSSSALLKILSVLYGAVIRTRNILYDKGFFRIIHTPPLVVSIGNIEAGGTGKTPFTMALAEELRKRGRRVCILTRGYRGSLKGPVLIRAGNREDEAGDEALLMARSMNVPVIKSPDRVKGALFAHVHFGCEIVVLDDGFQHRRIHRDLDIVLISRDVEHACLLPAGPLREPASSLKRADIIIPMKVSGHQVAQVDLKPVCLVNIQGTLTGLESVTGKKALAFCAIGTPEHFFRMAEGLGVKIERHPFRDHHRYTQRDFMEIMDMAAGKDLILTTEKDLVKIDPAWVGNLSGKLHAVRVAIDMPGLEKIADEIEHLAENRRLS
jgi:tetraacyldisaccharide 4'-kinase